MAGSTLLSTDVNPPETVSSGRVNNNGSRLPLNHPNFPKSYNPINEPELDERICRSCLSKGAMVEDWKAGDRICTNCGVVDEDHLMDDSPEWKDFNDADDVVRRGGVNNSARSGLVPTDETKYLGGLQPTTLSKHVYSGGPCSSRSRQDTGTSGPNSVRKRLMLATSRVESRIEKANKRALEKAKVSLQIARKRAKVDNNNDDESYCVGTEAEEIRPEYEEMLLQEEEDANRIQMGLYADKWSLQRAIRLHGNGQQQSSFETESCAGEEDDGVEELRGRLDPTLRKASSDLFAAYTILTTAAQKLNLSTAITNEATNMLCQYAQRKDGLAVRGVVSISSNNPTAASVVRARTNRMPYGNNPRKSKQLLQQHQARQQRRWSGGSNSKETTTDKEMAAARREYNKWKQMGALSSAFLFFSARNMNSPRSLIEVCESIQPPNFQSADPNALNHQIQEAGFIKRKHFSRAMTEIKEFFPDFVQSSSMDNVTAAEGSTTAATARDAAQPCEQDKNNDRDDIESVTNYAEHAIQKLGLPPVAEASIRCLVLYWRKQRKLKEMNKKTESKLDMTGTGSTKLPTVCAGIAFFVCLVGSTMQSLASQAAKAAAVETRRTAQSSSWNSALSSKLALKYKQSTKTSSQSSSSTAKVKKEKFDIFAQDASKVGAEQRAYEMRRMWDAWTEQTPWGRSIASVEKSCGVSRNVIREFYKKHLFPC